MRNPEKLERLKKNAERKTRERVQRRVAVEGTMTNLHPLVQTTLDALKRAKPNKAGLLEPTLIRALDVAVTPDQRDRALCILDAFIRAVEREGILVHVATRGERRSWVVYEGHQIAFWLREDMDQIEHKPTSEEEKKPEVWWRRSEVRRWDEKPSGRLRVRIDSPGTSRATWADTTRYRLEDTLDPVISAIRRVPALREEEKRKDAERQRELEEQRRRWQEEEQRRQEERRLAEEERRRAEQLREAVRRWREASDYRAYADALQAAATPNGAELVPWGDVARTVTWIRAYADRIDPLTAGV